MVWKQVAMARGGKITRALKKHHTCRLAMILLKSSAKSMYFRPVGS